MSVLETPFSYIRSTCSDDIEVWEACPCCVCVKHLLCTKTSFCNWHKKQNAIPRQQINPIPHFGPHDKWVHHFLNFFLYFHLQCHLKELSLYECWFSEQSLCVTRDIYIWCFIQRITMCPHGYHHSGSMATPALGTRDVRVWCFVHTV